MKRPLVLLGLLGCASAPAPVAAVSLPAQLPSPPPVETATSARETKPQLDAADFTSERGVVHLAVDAGAGVAGSFGASGVLTCAVARDRFDCRWYDNSSSGHALLQRAPDGRLVGTWGNGESADDAGNWTLVPLGTSGLEGVWDTNFGLATIQTTNAGVHVEYRDGTMDCQVTGGKKLACAWTEGSSTGHAELTLESPRVLRGRWGSGASATDGGGWLFVRR